MSPKHGKEAVITSRRNLSHGFELLRCRLVSFFFSLFSFFSRHLSRVKSNERRPRHHPRHGSSNDPRGVLYEAGGLFSRLVKGTSECQSSFCLGAAGLVEAPKFCLAAPSKRTNRAAPPVYRSLLIRHVAFQVCAAVTCFWEESEEQLQQQSGGFGVALVVFDTLADACFVSFNDGDSETLSSALGAMWAADGALRRGFSRERQAPYQAGDGERVSPGGGESVASSSPTLSGGDRPASGEGGGADNSAADPEFARRPSMESPSDTASAAVSLVTGGEFGPQYSGAGNTGWAQESRMVDVVRSLAQRCRGLPTRIEDTDASDGAEVGDGDHRAGSSTGGIGASLRSEEEPGGGATWPLGALSLLELAEAVLDAVGPEATMDVLAACPQLLENMPPEVCIGLRFRMLRLSSCIHVTLAMRSLPKTFCGWREFPQTSLDGNEGSTLGPLALSRGNFFFACVELLLCRYSWRCI